MEQIEEKEYTHELVSEGYKRIMKIALGVDWKVVEGVFEEYFYLD
jgi:hypothetical protein